MKTVQREKMVKKILSAIVSAAALVGATTLAHADFINPGFETGSLAPWFTSGTGSAAVISTTPSAPAPSGGSDSWAGAPGASGSFMAALTTGADTEFVYQAALPTSTNLILWINFMSAELFSSSPGLDFVTANVFTLSGPLSYSLTTSDTSFMSGHFFPSSGWVPFLLPTGTLGLIVTLHNGGDPSLPAFELIDITTATAAVPEPEIYAMMAAGLGLMGFVARRRKGQAAA